MAASGCNSERPHTGLPIFVYGTLQRGEQRDHLWPRLPLRVQWATVSGRVHDLGAFPALVPGPKRVLGELWYLAAEDLAVTFEALDAIEGFRGKSDDLYVRRLASCVTGDGRRQPAHVYFYARPAEIAHTPTVAPGPNGLVHWRRFGSTWPPG